MEDLLRQIIEQNERLIAAVTAIGEKIDDMRDRIRGDLISADSSVAIASIQDKLSDVVSALEWTGTSSVFTSMQAELERVAGAVELLDSTVQVSVEELKGS
jgi:hypothetical protein